MLAPAFILTNQKLGLMWRRRRFHFLKGYGMWTVTIDTIELHLFAIPISKPLSRIYKEKRDRENTKHTFRCTANRLRLEKTELFWPAQRHSSERDRRPSGSRSLGLSRQRIAARPLGQAYGEALRPTLVPGGSTPGPWGMLSWPGERLRLSRQAWEDRNGSLLDQTSTSDLQAEKERIRGTLLKRVVGPGSGGA